MITLTTEQFDIVNYGAFTAGQRWANLELPRDANPYSNARLRAAWDAGFANPDMILSK